jgi:cyclopropane fatty-acyl-phospholipid synthase-like methyltransferase
MDQMKLHWKLFSEWYSNEKILEGFYNPVKNYIQKKTGTIIDIGCGQSSYLIDFLNSEFELYAVDTDKDQLKYLQNRVIKAGYDKNRITYSSNEFPSKDFSNNIFSAVIISNLLHFFPKSYAFEYVNTIKKYCEDEALIMITVHSSEHLHSEEITPESYFKSFYTKADLESMFPISEFEHLYYLQVNKAFDNYTVKFIEHWIKEVCNGQLTLKEIKAEQEDYLRDGRTTSIDFMVKKRSTTRSG